MDRSAAALIPGIVVAAPATGIPGIVVAAPATGALILIGRALAAGRRRGVADAGRAAQPARGPAFL